LKKGGKEIEVNHFCSYCKCIFVTSLYDNTQLLTDNLAGNKHHIPTQTNLQIDASLG